jgi:O-antigen ligase
MAQHHYGAGRVPLAPPLGFALFLVLNVVMFIRPQEWVADLRYPFYQVAMAATLVVCLPALAGHLFPTRLPRFPVGVCVLGVFAAVILSHVSHSSFDKAQAFGADYFKTVLYYFLFLAVTSSAPRLGVFLRCLVVSLGLVNLLAVLIYFELVDIPALTTLLDRRLDERTGEYIIHRRMVGPGILNDPNDLGLMLVVGMGASLYLLTAPRQGALRLLWASLLGFFGYGLTLTHSRGAFLSLLAGTVVLLTTRFGWRKTVPLMAVVLPVMLVVFGGRQTSISQALASDTGQGRIQIWSDGLDVFRQAPLFGVGVGEFGELVGHAAHNSFVQCYAELGLFGGIFFTGAFYCAFRSLIRLGQAWRPEDASEVTRLRPYILAILTGYTMGTLSLTRSYTLTTYLVLGLVETYVGVAAAGYPILRFDARLARTLVVVGVAVLVIIHVVVRLLVNWDVAVD